MDRRPTGAEDRGRATIIRGAAWSLCDSSILRANETPNSHVSLNGCNFRCLLLENFDVLLAACGPCGVMHQGRAAVRGGPVHVSPRCTVVSANLSKVI